MIIVLVIRVSFSDIIFLFLEEVSKKRISTSHLLKIN